MIANIENENMVLPVFKPRKYVKIDSGQGKLHFRCHRLNYKDKIFKFPNEAKTKEEKQAQQMNYDYFIQTLTELVKKYASNIEEVEQYADRLHV